MAARTLAPVIHYLRQIDHDDRRDTDADLLWRFVHAGDETAFATILRRHGPMVYAVCRRALCHRHDAEDAFQATFLVLVRKARLIGRPNLLGHWLHGVAYRIALKARSRSRHRAECNGLPVEPAAPASEDVLWRDLRPVIDAAIDDLPPRYRVPFVLCHLQGLTHAQAARQLGCAEGTVATRLSRARQRLRIRLARYSSGIAGAAALGIDATSVSAAVPALLLVSTIRTAIVFRTGVTIAVPETVAGLMEGVCRTMFMTKWRNVLILLALVVAASSGMGGWVATGQEGQSAPAKALQAQPPTKEPARPRAAPDPFAVPAPAVQNETGPAVVRTDNFMVRAPTRRIALLAGTTAERFRKSEALRWLGKELPAWAELCPLEVVIRHDGVLHATTFQYDAGRLVSRNMVVEGSLDHVLSNGLPHEITHTVLADYLGTPPPRWADEGAAMTAEDDEEQQRYRAVADKLLLDKARLIPLRRLLPMVEYPPDTAVLYGQGYSLTRFLVQARDCQTFVAFVKDGMSGNGWDKAVKRHYGFANVEHLEKSWLDRVQHDAKAHAAGPGTTAMGKLTSVPPIIGRALIDAQGRLAVRKPVAIWQPRIEYASGPPTDEPRSITRYVQIVEEQATDYELRQVGVTDVAGKPIDAKMLSKRLQTETPVLIAGDGNPVDPYYLAVIRQDTIVLMPPAPSFPPTEPRDPVINERNFSIPAKAPPSQGQ
jgi:RNA polymerase sigma factor (sigma-70 family)